MFKVLAYVLGIRLYCGGDFCGSFKSLSRRQGTMAKCYWFKFRQHISEYGSISLYRKFEAKCDRVYTLGCPCHIIHNKASHASNLFGRATGFDVGDFLVDIYYYFDDSTKRQALLKEFCNFCDQEYRKILKFGATCWLSKEGAAPERGNPPRRGGWRRS